MTTSWRKNAKCFECKRPMGAHEIGDESPKERVCAECAGLPPALYDKRRAEAAAATLDKPDDIGKLPWAGNHAWDHALFDRCEQFIVSLSDRELQRRAIWLMCKFGMGIDEPVSDGGLDDFLSNARS